MTHWRFSCEKPEVGLDGRQRDVHDRDVEHDHELHRAEQRQREPLAARRGHRWSPFRFVSIELPNATACTCISQVEPSDIHKLRATLAT